MKPIKILGLASSLRKGSTTTGLLRVAATKMPSHVSFEILVPKDIPLFNEDTETELSQSNQNLINLRKKCSEADGFLFSLCEYNHSLSAPFKNALDWGSRGPLGNCFDDKVAGVMSAGGKGWIRAQQHLRDVAHNLNLYVVNHPQTYVNIFDPSKPVDFGTGEVTDPNVVKQVDALVQSLVKFAERLRKH